jgi:hypothetical protein
VSPQGLFCTGCDAGARAYYWRLHFTRLFETGVSAASMAVCALVRLNHPVCSRLSVAYAFSVQYRFDVAKDLSALFSLSATQSVACLVIVAPA